MSNTSASSAASPAATPRAATQGAKTTRWSVSDIVVASTLAVAAGVIFWGWNLGYQFIGGLFAAYPPVATIVHGMWLFPGVLGALIIRKPGAAIYCELVAAVVSALLGSQWGLTVLSSGFVQGLGAELIFLAVLYRRFTVDVAVLAGALSGFFGGATYHWIIPMYAYAPLETFIHIGCFTLSGAIIAGALMWAATRGLAATSVLGPLASRRAHREPVVGSGAGR